MHLSHLGRSFNVQSGSCFCIYAQTAFSASSLLWNRRPNSCRFSSQNITCYEVWYFSMEISLQQAIFRRKRCCSRLIGNFWNIRHQCICVDNPIKLTCPSVYLYAPNNFRTIERTFIHFDTDGKLLKITMDGNVRFKFVHEFI